MVDFMPYYVSYMCQEHFSMTLCRSLNGADVRLTATQWTLIWKLQSLYSSTFCHVLMHSSIHSTEGHYSKATSVQALWILEANTTPVTNNEKQFVCQRLVYGTLYHRTSLQRRHCQSLNGDWRPCFSVTRLHNWPCRPSTVSLHRRTYLR